MAAMNPSEIARQLDEQDVVMRLGELGDPVAISFLLSRRNCPGEYLSSYAQRDFAIHLFGKKQGTKIREIARSHANLPRADIEEHIEWGINNQFQLDDIAAILRNRVILTEDIEKLIASTSGGYDRARALRLCAGNPRFPVALYEEAISSDNPYVVSALASNPAISVNIIMRIMKSDNPKVLDALVRNRSIRKNIIAQLLEAPYKPELFPSYLLKSIAQRLPDGEEFDNTIKYISERDNLLSTKTFVASLTRDAVDLALKCLDDDVQVRQAAVKNPITPESARAAAALLGTPITISPRGGLRPRKRAWK